MANLNPDYTNKQIHTALLICAVLGLGFALMERAFGLSWRESMIMSPILFVLSGCGWGMYRIWRGRRTQ